MSDQASRPRRRRRWKPLSERRLTETQVVYLRAIDRQLTGSLRKGWGGYGSTQTVRILAERGFIRLQSWPREGRSDDWEAKITEKGRAKLAELYPERTP